MKPTTRPTPTRALLTLVATAVMLLAVGCGPSTAILAPGGFVNLEEDQLGYDVAQKAISPDGTLIVVRERDHEPVGSLDFWAEAMLREMTEGNGYKHLETKDVTSKGGYKGKVLSFLGAYNESNYRYDIGIFLTSDEIVTVEAVAPEADYEQHKTALEAAIQSLHPH